MKAFENFDLEYARMGKICAIKELRNCTALGLKEAKDIVEAITDGCTLNAQHRIVDLQRQNQDMGERLFDLNNELNKKNRIIDALVSKMDKMELVELLLNI